MKYLLRTILTPSCWLRNENTDKEWNKKLNEILDDENLKIERGDKYIIKINNIPIWIENYPYSYGYIFDRIWKTSLPSRATVFRLKKVVDKFLEEEHKKDRKKLYKKYNI